MIAICVCNAVIICSIMWLFKGMPYRDDDDYDGPEGCAVCMGNFGPIDEHDSEKHQAMVNEIANMKKEMKRYNGVDLVHEFHMQCVLLVCSKFSTDGVLKLPNPLPYRSDALDALKNEQ